VQGGEEEVGLAGGGGVQQVQKDEDTVGREAMENGAGKLVQGGGCRPREECSPQL
jgi:hypothetical protein